MSWAGITSNQCVSLDNLIDAVSTGVFTALTTIPTGGKQITKSEAQTYVSLDTAYAPFAAKASNQLVVKSDLLASGATTTTTTTLAPSTLDWSISRAVGGGSATMTIKNVSGTILLSVTSTAVLQTGSLSIPNAQLPYSVTVDVTGTAGATYRICNTSAGGEIYSATVPDGGSDTYTVTPTPVVASVNCIYGGTPPSCPV